MRDLGTAHSTAAYLYGIDVPQPRAAPTPHLQPSIISCLECGNSYAALATHLSRIHKISVAEYRRQHNLPHTPLASLATSRIRLAAQRQPDSHESWTALRISELRRARGVSQQHFAALCKVTSTTVRNWEKGRTTPQPRARLRLQQLDPGTGS
ncbi:MucR family transcriptional regulator [Rhizomonospora bruguierae]|uniref:MucR family transcriptional regulator n=1 Tax=Rhizomonospora bruguierae TaxID=1581705 RepID=UPI0035E421AB